MSTRFWVVITLAMPGGIGSVLYFLLRQPVVARCPSCGTSIHAEFHFCPHVLSRFPRPVAIAIVASGLPTSTASTAAIICLRITCPPASAPSNPELPRIDRGFSGSLYTRKEELQ